MKKVLIIISIILASGVFTGCKKYLELPPKNKFTVTTVADVQSVLASYLRAITVPTLNVKPILGTVVPMAPVTGINLFEAYSDNIDFETALTQTYLQPNNFRNKNQADYADLLLWNQYSIPGLLWSNHYEVIGFMNALIDDMDHITDATPQQRDQLLGEMYTNRAWYFFKLLEYFAPYSKADLGIPVYLHTGESVVGVQPPRASHAEVYKVILSDLNNALQMAERTPPVQGYNKLYSKRCINNLLAQVYWWKAESPAKEATDYEKVKTHALAALEGVDPFIPTTTAGFYNALAGKDLNYPAICMQQTSPQGTIAILYGSEFQFSSPGTYGPENIPLSAEFANLFDQTDIRIAAYFNTNPNRAGGKVGTVGRTLAWEWPADRSTGGYKSGNVALLKPEEAYLMLAEAYYRLNDVSNAIATLNKFKSFRNAGTANGLSGQALLTEIINERRREFFTDYDHRWLDLKRYANKTITRSLTFFQKQYNITVPPNDFRYALPIPLKEIANNKNMIPNEGWVVIEY